MARLVFVLVAVALLCGLSYGLGVRMERGRNALAEMEAATEARKAAEAEAKRRQKAAVAAAVSDALSREARLNGELEALRRAPRAGCDWNDERLRGISGAVDAANGTTP